jgi:hypothetical protein
MDFSMISGYFGQQRVEIKYKSILITARLISIEELSSPLI